MSGRVLVVSHPAVLAANQVVYDLLRQRGWEVHLLVPGRWKHDYEEGTFPPSVMPGLAATTRSAPVAFAGAPQRHLHLTRTGHVLDDVRPEVVFLEEETYSLTAMRWRHPLVRRGIPFGVQSDENLDRSLPRPVRLGRRAVLRDAAFVAARSRRAAQLVSTWGARCPTPVIAHTILGWSVEPREDVVRDGVLTVGYAGRFIPEKGIDDLLAATEAMRARVVLRFFGDGPMRRQLEGAGTDRRPVEVVTGVSHHEMGEAYASVDVLVLPSRTTPDWSEQFGRVMVESMGCGRPVVGSDSGEIPWVIESAGGGVTFPEGDVVELARTLDALAEDPARRFALGKAGKAGVAALFSAEAVADQLGDALRAAMMDGTGSATRMRRVLRRPQRPGSA